MATLILTNEFKSILEKQGTIDALAANGYDSTESFVKEILKRLNKFDSSLNLKSISYHNLQDSDTYIGIILDEYLNKLYNVCVIPPTLGTRSGFLSQQIFGFISNLIIGQRNKNSYSLCDKPVIIVNCMVDSLANSAICNIIGSKIVGFHYIDIFNRNEDFGNSNLNLRDYVSTVSQYKDISKDIELTSDTLILKTQRLKNFSTSLTNEPYYFAITAYPAVILAKKEGYTIDVKDFEEKLANGKSNKNIDAFLKFVKDLKTTNSKSESMHLHNQLQLIYYGAPGTGKSYKTNEVARKYSTIRTTFHPDSDYSTFVGAYKPTTIKSKSYGLNSVGETKPIVDPETGKTKEESKIEYRFVKQAFLKAYVQAWKFFRDAENVDDIEPQFLVIEEINRGNCAQIFGDLFQLLDRKDGFSEYPIEADEDISKSLTIEDTDKDPSFGEMGLQFTDSQKEAINAVFNKDEDSPYRDVASEIAVGKVLVLPPNLYIWATMNTSDQSLFPIDSAFKRRWDWVYIPIDTHKEEWYISVNGIEYSWPSFLDKINDDVLTDETAEDKHLGFYFCKAEDNIISAEKFVSKVLFYLWNDVFKVYGVPEMLTKGDKNMTFHKFYNTDGTINETLVAILLDNIGVEKKVKEHTTESDSDEPVSTTEE